MSSVPAAVSTGSSLSATRPFPGLRPFEERDADWFFGRSSEINELLKRLRNVRFVAVVGPSGCGKSSLIKAGILSSIREGYLDVAWSIAAFRPGEEPLNNLAKAVSGAISSDCAGLRKTLDSGSMALARAIESQPLSRNRKLLILVDQFEEVFQFAQRHGDQVQEEVKAFLKLLLNAATSDDAGAYIVLTMRMEWLSECATYVGLAEAINEGIYLVPQMSRRQFQQVILSPIEAARGTINSALVDRMLNDLGGRTDQLPILQHALMRLWEIRQGVEALEIANYERIGTFSNCLSSHAEEIYGELSDGHKKVAELLFRSITQVYKNRKVRRPQRFGELTTLSGVDSAQLKVVIEAFGRQGRSFLFTTEGPLEPSSVVDISHEALIRQWSRLNGWVEDEADKQSRVSRLEEDAAEWDRGKRKDRSALYRGYKLQRAKELTPRLEGSGSASAFLKASHRAQRWRRVWLRGSLAALLISVVVVLLAVQRNVQHKASQAELAAALSEQRSQLSHDNIEQADREVVQLDAYRRRLEGELAAINQQAKRNQQLVAGTKSIFIHYVGNNQVGLVNNIRIDFQEPGYLLPRSGEQVRPNNSPHENQVRYFNKGDEHEAGTIANQLTPLLTGKVAIQSTSNPYGVVPVGQFEIWLAKDTTEANP